MCGSFLQNRVVIIIACLTLSACGMSLKDKSVVHVSGGPKEQIITLASISGEVPFVGGEEGVGPQYLLGPEDVLEVIVWKNEALTKTVLVRPDGKVSLPLLGDMQAAGLTTSQLRDAIRERLIEYKETPEVSVIVRGINSYAIYVLGEVTRPGKYRMKGDTTFLQAIAMSGGFTKFARLNKILLLRKEGGYEARTRIRYKDVVSGKNPDGNVLLKRGDTIVVP